MPIIGTNKVRDIVDTGYELQTLDASRRKGKLKNQIQQESMRRTPTWYKNAWAVEVGSSKAGAIYSSNDKKVYEYTDTMSSIWFSIFILGEKRRMGVVRSQDEALTVNQLLLIGYISEKDWVKSNYW